MLKAIKSKNLLLLSIGNSISQLGDRFTHMALIGFIGEYQPGSPLAFGKMAFFFTLPVIIGALPSGKIADIFDKKKILILGDFLRALLLFYMGFLVMKGNMEMWKIYGAVFLLFLFTIPFNVARSAFIPQIVPEEMLLTANSFLIFLARISTVLGTVLGGWLSDRIPLYILLFIDGLTYLLSMFLIMFIRPVRRAVTKISSPLKIPFREIFQFKLQYVYLSIFIFGVITSGTYTLVVPFIQQTRELGETGVGASGGILALGMILGAYLMGNFVRERYLKSVFLLSFVSLISFYLLIPTDASFALILFFSFVSGIFSSIIGITQDTLIQKRANEEVRGILFGMKEILISLTFLVFVLVFGYLGERTSIIFGIRSLGIVAFIFALPLLRFH